MEGKTVKSLQQSNLHPFAEMSSAQSQSEVIGPVPLREPLMHAMSLT